MYVYTLTVFEKTGEKLIQEAIEVATEKEAKLIATKILEKNNYENKTYRCTTPKGKLILFH